MEYHRVNEKEPDVGRAILHLYRNNLYVDATLVHVSANISFCVHKLVVSMHSPVLSDKFYPKDNSAGCDVIYIERFSVAAVRNMIRHFYGEPLVFENISHVKETKRIAERYKMKQLYDICVNKIHEVTVDDSNVLLVLEMSREYGNKEKENECFDVMSRSNETVFESESFMKMEFESICFIFEKLREMGSLTEVQYLRSALRWMSHNGNANKDKLMKNIQISKLSTDEFRDVIISFPLFFTNVEISKAFERIKSSHSTRETTQTQEPVEVLKQKGKPVILFQDLEIDGIRFAYTTFISNIAERHLMIKTEFFKESILESWLQENDGEHLIKDVDITYEGLYLMIKYLENANTKLSPLNCVEVFKAAVFLHHQELQDIFLKKLVNIIECDPVFLDALRQFPFLEDRLIENLRTETLDVFNHPNFMDCSYELMGKLLTQPDLCVSSEFTLLLFTISWLKARNRLRWEHRFSLLNEIAFENISLSFIKYDFYLPILLNFFTEDEWNSLKLYKTDRNDENKASLPEWYNFKNRNYTKA